LEIIIAVALGLAAIVTASAVYLNEHQEHKAEVDFHSATHEIVRAVGVGALAVATLVFLIALVVLATV
jgi:hypothetical protein